MSGLAPSAVQQRLTIGAAGVLASVSAGLSREAICAGRIAASAQVGRDALSQSRRHLPYGIPGACRDLSAEGLLDERHEDRSSGTWDVRAEDLAALHAQDARAIELDRQLELRPRRVAQERDHALSAGRQPERSIWVGGEDRAKRIQRAHDGEERTAKLLLHRGLDFALERRLGGRAGAEDDVAAREDRLHVGEAARLEAPLQIRHLRVHRAHAPEERRVASHRRHEFGYAPSPSGACPRDGRLVVSREPLALLPEPPGERGVPREWRRVDYPVLLEILAGGAGQLGTHHQVHDAARAFLGGVDRELADYRDEGPRPRRCTGPDRSVSRSL